MADKLDPSWIGKTVKYIYGPGNYSQTDYIVRNVAIGGHLAWISPAITPSDISTANADRLILKSEAEPQSTPEVVNVFDDWNLEGDG